MKKLAKDVETHALGYAGRNNPALLRTLEAAKATIPSELRVCDTLFTAIALVGDGKDGLNHEHLDDHDVISIFVTLGQDITGGSTLYFDSTSFSKKDPSGSRGSQVHAVAFEHGQYQVGPFEEVVHAGDKWTGPRVVMSFYLNRPILDHFRQYGDQVYVANRDRMYGLEAPQIVDAVPAAATAPAAAATMRLLTSPSGCASDSVTRRHGRKAL